MNLMRLFLYAIFLIGVLVQMYLVNNKFIGNIEYAVLSLSWILLFNYLDKKYGKLNQQ